VAHRVAWPDLLFVPEPCGSLGILALLKNRMEHARGSVGLWEASPCLRLAALSLRRGGPWRGAGMAVWVLRCIHIAQFANVNRVTQCCAVERHLGNVNLGSGFVHRPASARPLASVGLPSGTVGIGPLELPVGRCP
jgi:hypothetical protein